MSRCPTLTSGRLAGRIAGAAFAFGALTLLPATVSAAPLKVAVGALTCKSDGNVGLIIGSKERLNCRFSTLLGSRHYHYIAWITKVGVDIGYKGKSTLVWTVLGTTTDIPETALEGTYAGVTAGVAVGIGANANALVGGFGQSIILQPLSVEGQTGFNISAGVAGLTLQGG